ncbi:alpha/beta hydrolase [Dolichospermum sp. UHCC 0684]|jgi:pimeloyl-ACP methyl ester carboxylesterase|uniref:Alpha/beta hydrolase n=1 Tax=Dolichospermum flos-aquae CCAP 1403/13F TaxID=315271 RepID=A0A6H2C1A9_DOLFA|nr:MULTISPECIES: alpha/beta hydrolase [Dolichospermum]MBS9386147.1 alpha/beta hydrolase [Dolichospermum sp. BR01]MEA5531965.1 alpha/beta hydrolase [Dolichospermum sp. UHCC 0684]MTJ15906.1 alpha/beta hydrolase [Dolichospermum sp. UHCC 0299]MTJ20249.1 alpha/beta hydrolase [Dolichospermum sp. UHCC 0352]MTJ35987.1 alpha/beta hydrolase [Dolichospermum sp. UHCC 0260]
MPAVDPQPCFLTPKPVQSNSPLFIYLPGMDGSGELLQTQISELASCLDIRCLAIPKNYLATWDVLARNVLDLIHAELETSCQRPIYLCGESFGGCLAMQVAIQSPQLFKRIILINPASSLHQQFWFNWISQMTQFVPSSLFNLGALGLLPFLASLARISQSDRYRLLTAMRSLPSATVNWRLSLLRDFHVDKNDLQRLTQEILLIGSGSDLLLPSVSEIARLAEILPNNRTFLLPNSGHACLLEKDVNLYQILKDNDFLEFNINTPKFITSTASSMITKSM